MEQMVTGEATDPKAVQSELVEEVNDLMPKS